MSDLLNSASLVMIPSGYKEDVVYSAVPTDGSGDLSFTRASNGTRVNSAGLVEVCPWNLVEDSNTFNGSGWTKNAVTLTSGQADKDGTTNAWKVEFTGGSSDSYIYQLLASGQKTGAIWVKGTAGQTAMIGIRASVGSGVLFTFNGSWQQVIETSTDLYFVVSDFAGATATTFFIQYAQANIGSTAKPYFPTTDRLNVPRLTYQNGGGGCPSLLLEKQSTNLFTYSEQFDNADWTKIATSVTANSAISPDGTQNADTLNSTTYTEAIFQVSASGTITFSVYAKAGTTTSLQLASTTSFNGRGADFNLSNGTASAVYQIGSGNAEINGGTSSIVNVGNGWYRCIISGLVLTASRALTIANNNGNASYLWGAQLEASSYPTSYISTTSASATRVADGPLNLSTTQTLTNFTIFWDGLIFENGQNMLFGSGNSAWYIDIDGSIGRIVLDLASGRIYQSTNAGITTNQRFKLAVKRTAGVVEAFVNGTKLTPTVQVTDTTSLTLSSITWGFSSTYYPKMKVNEICAFQSALSDSDCQALTTI
jgi:hypothetical protein